MFHLGGILQPSSASVLATYTAGLIGDTRHHLSTFRPGQKRLLVTDLESRRASPEFAALLESTAEIKSPSSPPAAVEVHAEAGAKSGTCLLNPQWRTKPSSFGPFKDLLTGATHTGKAAWTPSQSASSAGLISLSATAPPGSVAAAARGGRAVLLAENFIY